MQNLEEEFEAVERLGRELKGGVGTGLKEVTVWDTEWGRKGLADAGKLRGIKIRFGKE